MARRLFKVCYECSESSTPILRANNIDLEKLAETLTPGQGQELIEIAQLQSQAREKQKFEQSITNEMVQSLKQVYDMYVKQKMPFIEQVRLLSLLPRSWKYEKVMNIFGCTRHAVTAAHQMHDDEEYVLNRDQESVIRQRADPEKIKHFVGWLVESNTLASGRLRSIIHNSCGIHALYLCRYLWPDHFTDG